MQHTFTRVKEKVRRMNIFLPSSLILLPFIIVAAVFAYIATAQQQLKEK